LTRFTTVLSLCLALALASLACERTPAANPDRTNSPATEVNAIADELWQHLLDRDMDLRVTNGLPVEELPRLSLEEDEAEAVLAAELLERLASIEAESLPHEDYLTLRILQTDLAHTVEAPRYYWNMLSLSPYLSLYTWRSIGNVFGALELTSSEDLARYHKLLGDYSLLLTQHLEKAEAQAERGIRLPKPAIPGTIRMLQGFRHQAAALATIEPERIESLEPNTRASFEAEVEPAVAEVVAGFDSLVDLLSGEYSDLAPEAVGAYQFEDGQDFYRHRASYFTTSDMTPEEIHELGLERVRELGEEMARIRAEVGFVGSREEFHEELRTDTRFVAANAGEVEARYARYVGRIEERIGDYFSSMPKAPYGIRRLTPAEEVNSTWGYYKPPDSIDPAGIYNYNGSKLDERSLVTAASLIFHELLPGHHFQVALQLENESLHPYRQNAYSGAFTEGWAEYAASLGQEMGLFDPYDRYGHLIMELFLAVRLVVDTGIGYLGWSLEEARDYMRERVFQSDTQIATETLRYATRPGQALAYRLGYEKIWELRQRAEHELGERFDIRTFHAAILGSGNLPLSVLDEHIDWWIQSTRSDRE
jgi:uncharacterized protein (DUF885 family)